MKKFIILTRGRTGSTAIIDELSTTKIFSLHELFLDFNTELPESFLNIYYQSILPFDLWKKCLLRKGNTEWYKLYKYQNIHTTIRENNISFILRKINDILPFMLNTQWKTGKIAEYLLINHYLNSIEKLAIEYDKDALVFKVLSHHFVERKNLFRILKNRDYIVILLIRKNILRQVLSGMIAKCRGKYNIKNFKDDPPPITIDLNMFEKYVSWEKMSIELDRQLLKKNGIKYLEIYYEDFCNDKETFYSNLFTFIGIKFESPKSTEFSVMVPDIRKAIMNYEALENKLVEMGIEGSLLDIH